MGILRKMFYTDYICQMKIINNMNENIDLTKILKDCPIGTKFYSPICGALYFDKIRSDEGNAIVLTRGVFEYAFTKEGFYDAEFGEECLLFPSKEQRDWSKFTAPWYKKERFDTKTLQPFDKVLVRDNYLVCWRCAFYSHKWEKDGSNTDRYATTSNSYTFCIPYNDDTKHLVGTTDKAPEFYRYWED